VPEPISPLPRLLRLRKRPDFLRAATGVKWVAPAFVLQAFRRIPPDSNGPRLGFTASRRVGGAVSRNFARRRLKEATRTVFAAKARAGTDYVLIARGTTCRHGFQLILADLDRALHMVHKRLDATCRLQQAAPPRPSSGASRAPLKQPGQ